MTATLRKTRPVTLRPVGAAWIVEGGTLYEARIISNLNAAARAAEALSRQGIPVHFYIDVNGKDTLVRTIPG